MYQKKYSDIQQHVVCLGPEHSGTEAETPFSIFTLSPQPSLTQHSFSITFLKFTRDCYGALVLFVTS